MRALGPNYLSINSFINPSQSDDAITYNSGELGKFDNPPALRLILPSRLSFPSPSTMEGPSDFTKSLKPFKGILESHEHHYRNTPAEARSPIIDEIMADIREAADQKGGKAAEDPVLYKVSANILLTAAASEQCFVGCSKSPTFMPTTDQFPRKTSPSLSRLGSNGLAALSLTMTTMTKLRRLSLPLASPTLAFGLQNGPGQSPRCTILSLKMTEENISYLLISGTKMDHLWS